jgi:hypothetical protein
MDDGACADYEILQQAALAAIMQHNLAESRLEIAKLQRNSPQIEALESVGERLLQKRIAAVRAYQEHLAIHSKAASAG